MLLTGTFPRSLDDKQRIALPKRLRDALAGGAEPQLFLSPGTDGSLALFGSAAFERMAERLALAPPAQQDVRAFQRLFFSQVEQVELDGQGRIRIPSPLVERAGLQDEVMLIGVQDHVEIWNRGRWESYVAEKGRQFDALAESVLGRDLK